MTDFNKKIKSLQDEIKKLEEEKYRLKFEDWNPDPKTLVSLLESTDIWYTIIGGGSSVAAHNNWKISLQEKDDSKYIAIFKCERIKKNEPKKLIYFKTKGYQYYSPKEVRYSKQEFVQVEPVPVHTIEWKEISK